MRGGVGQIKKGRPFFARLLLLEEAYCIVGEGVGGVEGFARGAFWVGQLLVAEGHVAGADGMKETGGPRYAAKVFIKAPLERPAVPGIVAQVPLACHEGGVVVSLECLGNGDALAIKVSLIGGRPTFPPIAIGWLGHVADACLVRVKTRHQGCPGGAAPSTVVELGEAYSSLGKGVEVRGVDFAAMVAEVGKSHVVHHDKDDIGSLGGLQSEN